MNTPVMKPSEALRKARELLTPEGAWTKRKAARDRLGNEVYAADPDAVCYCSYGAIWHFELSGSLEDRLEDFLFQAIDGLPIAQWNDADNRTHAEVLAAFDRAIALAEAAGQ